MNTASTTIDTIDDKQLLLGARSKLLSNCWWNCVRHHAVPLVLAKWHDVSRALETEPLPCRVRIDVATFCEIIVIELRIFQEFCIFRFASATAHTNTYFNRFQYHRSEVYIPLVEPMNTHHIITIIIIERTHTQRSIEQEPSLAQPEWSTLCIENLSNWVVASYRN